MVHTAHREQCVSPKSGEKKATSMFLKRQRNWQHVEAVDADAEHTPTTSMRPRHHPYLADYSHAARRRPRDWSVSKRDDRLEEEQHQEEEEEVSPYKQIQARVDQVGMQVAQAQRHVAELRSLLLQHAVATRPGQHSTPRRLQVPSSSLSSCPSSSSAQQRVRIDMLCA